MNQELELELTFLAKELPQDIKTVRPTRIVDVYIPDTPEHSHLRLRQKGDKYERTDFQMLSENELNALLKSKNAKRLNSETEKNTKIYLDWLQHNAN